MEHGIKIVLTGDEINRCIRFAGQAALNQQRIEFGQSDTDERSIPAMIVDTAVGKVGEAAFAKYCREYHGIIVNLDFNIYERGIWDDQDALINDWRIDIKSTKSGSKWLLVDWNKLSFRKHDQQLAHLYIMVTVGFRPSYRGSVNGTLTGEAFLHGGVFLDQLKHPQNKDSICRVLYKGDCIPNTSAKLQADNYGVFFKDLLSMEQVMRYIQNSCPPDTDCYTDPYDYETYSRPVSWNEWG